MKLLKKILKVGLAILSIAIVCLYLLFVYFSSPPSDEDIREKFASTPFTTQIKKILLKGLPIECCHLNKKKTVLLYSLFMGLLAPVAISKSI